MKKILIVAAAALLASCRYPDKDVNDNSYKSDKIDYDNTEPNQGDTEGEESIKGISPTSAASETKGKKSNLYKVLKENGWSDDEIERFEKHKRKSDKWAKDFYNGKYEEYEMAKGFEHTILESRGRGEESEF